MKRRVKRRKAGGHGERPRLRLAKFEAWACVNSREDVREDVREAGNGCCACERGARRECGCPSQIFAFSPRCAFTIRVDARGAGRRDRGLAGFEILQVTSSCP